MNKVISLKVMSESISELITKKIVYTHENVYLSEWSVKTEFVEPFLKECLGYDFKDRKCVIGELYSNVKQDKRTESKADFGLLNPITKEIEIIFECKNSNIDISNKNVKTQLFNYFENFPTTKIGVLTNGYKYVFYRKINNKITKMWDFDIQGSYGFIEVLNRCNQSNEKLLELLSMTKTVSIKSVMNEIIASNCSVVNEVIKDKLYSDYSCIADSDTICAIGTQYNF